jgi:ketosteroid isomerase-like protein
MEGSFMDEKVKVVQRLLDAFNRRDLQDLLAVMDPAVQFFAPQTVSSVGRETVYSGYEGFRQYFDDVKSVWGSLQVAP